MAESSSAPYAVVETKDLVETHRLIDHRREAEVVIAPVRGGMATRFRIGDDEILFLDQATLRDHTQNVRGGMPILFPFAGRLTGDEFVWEGKRFAMPQHGFARKAPWRITGTDTEGAAAITMSLDDSETTFADWPFRFRLVFRYELRDGALTLHQQYTNLGNQPMPIHPGLHPYFRVEDWRKREARIVTSATHAFDNRTGENRILTGPIDLGGGEVDLQLLDHGARQVRLDRPGRAAIELSFDVPETVVTVWALPGRDFVCVEPWSRQSDALNRGGAILVPAGGTHEAVLRIARPENGIVDTAGRGS
ncbi:MAG: aldose epimerase [Pseudomonadota bacterium]